MPDNNSQSSFLDNASVDLPDSVMGLFKQTKINPLNFSKYFPYQLAIVELDDKGLATPKFTFTLPIPPQELSINMPVATTVQATLGGIVEQHGGIPFKDIVLTGTTGVTPIKNTASGGSFVDGGDLNSDQLLRTGQAIFAGTVSAVQRTVKSGEKLLGNSNRTNVNKTDLSTTANDPDRIPQNSTGFYQFKLLERFLEAYALLKKKTITGLKLPSTTIANTKNLRLVFLIWKDDTAYFCSAAQFNTKRSAQSPMESTFTLQLRAWKRTSIDSAFSKPTSSFITSTKARPANYKAQLLDKINDIKDILNGVKDFSTAPIMDIGNTIGDVTRVVGLALKTKNDVLDYSQVAQAEIALVIGQNWDKLKNQVVQLFGKPAPYPFVYSNGTTTGGIRPVASIPTAKYSDKDINQILGAIDPLTLPISPELRKKLLEEKAKAESLTRLDYEKMRDKVSEFSDNFANAIGASSDSFNSIYSRPAVQKIKRASKQDYRTLFAINDLILVLNHLSANTEETSGPNTMEYVAGFAQRSGIAFRVPKSKYPVPFPYGFTLEKLAEIYLKDANRWHEIATLNGLRSPYIDEEGFSLSFQTNGNDNTFYLTDASNLYLRQTVYLSSNKIMRNKRHITNIKQIYPGYIAVTVDGTPDLNNYKLVDGAKLEAFLPNTINSQQMIYLPSDEDPAESPETAAVPGVDQFDPLLQVSGIDLLLNDDGDLVITSDGDARMSYGLQNIVQTVKIALSTPQGTLIQHPEFGFDIPVGFSTADVDATTILNSAKSYFESDPTFEGIVSASVQKQGPAAIITMVLKVKGLNQHLPITLRLV